MSNFRFIYLLLAAPCLVWGQFPSTTPRSNPPPAPGTAVPSPATGGVPVTPARPPIAPQVPTPKAPPAPIKPAQTQEEPSAFGTPVGETPVELPVLTDEEKAAGWKLLFDGKKLLGLVGTKPGDPLKAGWEIHGGALVLPKEVREMGRITGGDLATSEAYLDFDFKFEFKLAVSSSSGVRYLYQQTLGSTKPSEGAEYQITDDVHNAVSLRGGPLRRTGALEGIIATGPNARLRSADPENNIMEAPWNEGRILIKGNHVEHWLNGEKVVQYELGSAELKQAVVANKAKVPSYFGNKATTRLALLDEGLEISFRNLKILRLTPAVIPPRSASEPGPTTTAPGSPPKRPGPKVPVAVPVP